jgi:hypothetical protein
MSTDISQADWVREAESRRDIGIANAAAGADGARELWCQEAYELLTKFLVEQGGEPFLAEVFVRWATERIEAPHDPRAWGKPIQEASRRHLIERIGYAPANSSNRSPKALWRKRAGG